MICIYREYDPECAKNVRKVVIQADTTPQTFPTNGATVKSLGGGYLGESVVFAPGSLIHCVDTGKNYFMSEDGTTWNEDGATA